MKINDPIKVVINDRVIKASVAGFERGFGQNSPIKFVTFYIDWDEGPIKYTWPIEDVILEE